MAIAQMSWGRMRHDPDDARVKEFMDSLATVYADAGAHPGFIWRMDDTEAAKQVSDLGFDTRMAATVSVWKDVEALFDYSFSGRHGQYFDRRKDWFETVEGPQLVIWNVAAGDRPDFVEAFERLEMLKTQGPTEAAFGWPDSMRK